MRTLGRALVVTLALIASAGQADAATFDILYEDSHAIDPIVGSGTFSYDGPATVGSFALDSLTGMSFDAVIQGLEFTTADLRTNLSSSGISVFSLWGGQLGMVFTGSGGTVVGGSFDLEDSQGNGLTHEPTSAIDDPVGCCFNQSGPPNHFGLFDRTKYPLTSPTGSYYQATAIPEPGTLALCVLGLAGLAATRRSGR